MESLLPALGPACQLMLEHLWGTLLVVSESWTHVSGLPEFPWEILVCAVVLVLTLKRWHGLRSVNLRGQRSSAREEVCGKCSEDVGPRTQAEGDLKPPRVEASPPALQTLCLSAMNADLSGSLFQDLADFLENVWLGPSSPLSQVTDGKHTLQASEDDGEQPRKKEMSDVNNSVDFPESPEPSDQEIEREEQRVQEKEGPGGGPEPPEARKERVLEDRVNRLRATAERLLTTLPSPQLLGDRRGDGAPDVQQKKEAENGHPPGQGPEADLQGVNDDADGGVSLPRPEGEQQATARHPSGDQQGTEELPGRSTSLHIEDASLRCENSRLDGEIQLLRRKLQGLADLHDSCVMELHRRLFAKEARCLGSKKQFFSVCRELNSESQIRNLSKKIAGDVRKELERTAAFHQQEVRVREERAQESWAAAVRMEGELSALARENARLRQVLAQVEYNSQLAPRGLYAAPAAHRGPEGSGEPLGHMTPWGGGGSRREDSGTPGPLQP